MSETLQTVDPSDKPQIDIDALQKKQQQVLSGELNISQLSPAELTAIDTMNHPDRVDDIDKAHAMAEATTGQEYGMVRSRQRLNLADAAIAQLESSKNGAGLFEKARINREIRAVENDVSDIDSAQYWEEITAQRDQKAQAAADQYDAETRSAQIDEARAQVERVAK